VTREITLGTFDCQEFRTNFLKNSLRALRGSRALCDPAFFDPSVTLSPDFQHEIPSFEVFKKRSTLNFHPNKIRIHFLKKVSPARRNWCRRLCCRRIRTDLILHRPCKDIDFVCVGSGVNWHSMSSGLGGLPVNGLKNFGTAMIRQQDLNGNLLVHGKIL